MMEFTVSIGVTAMSADDSMNDILARADNALYEAKGAGRDRFVVK